MFPQRKEKMHFHFTSHKRSSGEISKTTFFSFLSLLQTYRVEMRGNQSFSKTKYKIKKKRSVR